MKLTETNNMEILFDYAWTIPKEWFVLYGLYFLLHYIEKKKNYLSVLNPISALPAFLHRFSKQLLFASSLFKIPPLWAASEHQK